MDAWLLKLYHSLGEPLAIEDPDMEPQDQDDNDYKVEVEMNHPLWDLLVANGAPRVVPKRYLNPGTAESLWKQYESDQHGPAGPVSRSCFLKRYNSVWAKVLVFRNVGQGKRCKDCARLDQLWAEAVDLDEKDNIIAEKKAHIEAVKADRLVNTRGNAMSEHDARHPSGDQGTKTY